MVQPRVQISPAREANLEIAAQFLDIAEETRATVVMDAKVRLAHVLEVLNPKTQVLLSYWHQHQPRRPPPVSPQSLPELVQ